MTAWCLTMASKKCSICGGSIPGGYCIPCYMKKYFVDGPTFSSMMSKPPHQPEPDAWFVIDSGKASDPVDYAKAYTIGDITISDAPNVVPRDWWKQFVPLPTTAPLSIGLIQWYVVTYLAASLAPGGDLPVLLFGWWEEGQEPKLVYKWECKITSHFLAEVLVVEGHTNYRGDLCEYGVSLLIQGAIEEAWNHRNN